MIFCCSCKNNNEQPEQVGFNLSVIAKNFPDSTKVYLYNRNIDKNIDSAYVINQRFDMSGKVDLPSLTYLNFLDKNNTYIEPYNYFFLENTDIKIIGEYSDFINAEVVGSYQSELLAKYNTISRLSDDSSKFSNQLNFLFSNANNQMALTELLYIKKEISKDSLLLFYNKLDSINSNSAKGLELFTYAKSIDIKVGDKFRDITGKDLEGNEHKLSDHYGKVILLDFWGTGCVPCRRQNKNEFPKLIEKYDNDDFIIISYSLDKKKEWWEKSTEEDKINWLNISDLKGMKSENVFNYAVTAIPNSFLIDQNGIIVKSFVGYYEGENRIEKEIDKLLNKTPI